ncbi:MAG TPA: hypothetical protein VFL76_08025 [Edaphocola sp.]|nr:hypothetical protein [Edaphocola sp.]
MKSRIIIPTLIWCITSCRLHASKQCHIRMDKVYVGLDAVEIYKRDKGSFKYLPPPPPAKESIANNAFIESDDGSIFSYTATALWLCDTGRYA